MTRADVEKVLLEVITQIAPDVRGTPITKATRLREDLEIDSFDQLRVVTELHARLNVDVPESDYSHLATFGSAVDYLLTRLPSSEAHAP